MDPRDFGFMTSTVRQKRITQLRRSGVIFIDESSVFIGSHVNIGFGTLVHPNVEIFGEVEIGKRCEIEMGVTLKDMKIGDNSTIHSNCYLADSSIGSGCRIWSGVRMYNSHLDDNVTVHSPNRIVGSKIGNRADIDSYCSIKYAIVGPNCKVGPSAILEGKKLANDELAAGKQTVKLAGHCTVGAQAHLHDWVTVNPEAEIAHCEIVRSFIGKRTIIKHCSYIGDAIIYRDCNIGAHTVFGNYDGKSKHRVIVKPGVFIGIHTSIISAKTGEIGEGAMIGADTLIKEEVEPGTVVVRKVGKLEVVGQSRRIKDGWEITKPEA